VCLKSPAQSLLLHSCISASNSHKLLEKHEMLCSGNTSVGGTLNIAAALSLPRLGAGIEGPCFRALLLISASAAALAPVAELLTLFCTPFSVLELSLNVSWKLGARFKFNTWSRKPAADMMLSILWVPMQAVCCRACSSRLQTEVQTLQSCTHVFE